MEAAPSTIAPEVRERIRAALRDNPGAMTLQLARSLGVPEVEIVRAFPEGRAGTIEIQARASGKDNVEIIFSDNGCGMSLDVRRRAFDPFFTTRRDQGGTGLGLHIVYSIVTTRLGGRLDLDSAPGAGTRIQMILPRVAPLEQAAE